MQPPSPVSPGFLSVGGLYVDKFYHKVSGSPKGLRMVAQVTFPFDLMFAKMERSALPCGFQLADIVCCCARALATE